MRTRLIGALTGVILVCFGLTGCGAPSADSVAKQAATFYEQCGDDDSSAKCAKMLTRFCADMGKFVKGKGGAIHVGDLPNWFGDAFMMVGSLWDYHCD